ncbi:hypothetical protein T02_9919 [Trichinella nativa]|uniref:Uncharacterized protein n=1 Tax=Trichinella nativa TaxID=6335 RepID=A0A0V1L5L9_9BILA|nr:hypothetical protein T02_9919 [Trichinella nativa]
MGGSHRRGRFHSVRNILPPDGELVLPSLMRAGSSTVSLATGLVISAVEVRSRVWEEFRHLSEGASHARDVVLQTAGPAGP